MPRYPEWFKKVGDTAAHPKALDVGKKLLGYLAIRRETPGVQTLVQRVTLDDGTTVEASFAGDQPQVIVYSPDGKDACELYVESGLLDLGPNIASDADKRFNRGPPEFGDTPATLYFGDGVDCKQGEAGLNGKVRVNPSAKTLASECLPTQGKSVQSRLHDPKKKQAQAMLPASCWSGLMQRYVQAVYGGDTLKYSASGNTLIVEGVPVGGIGNSVGLFDVGGELLFVYCGSSSITAAPVRFKNSCGEAVYRAWRKSEKAPKQQRDKLLAVALSCAFPDAEKQTILLDGFYHEYVSQYGWAFSEQENEAHAVAIDDNYAKLLKLSISTYNGETRAAISQIEEADLPPRYVSCGVSLDSRPPASICRKSSYSEGIYDVPIEYDNYDHPLTCYYDNGRLVVVRYSFLQKGQAEGVTEGDECYSMRYGRPTDDLSTTTDSEQRGRADGSPLFRKDDVFSEIPYVASVASGVYAKSSSGVLWTTIRTEHMFRVKRIKDKYNVIDGNTYTLPIVSLSMESDRGEPDGVTTYSGTGSNAGGAQMSGSHWKKLTTEYCGVPIYTYYATCGEECSTGACTQGIAYSPAEFGIVAELDGNCVRSNSEDLFAHTVEVSGNWSCTSPCYKTYGALISSTGIVGPANELAIVNGDCAAFVAMIASRGGVIHDGSFNYVLNVSERKCLSAAEGNCTGEDTWSCNGNVDSGYKVHPPHTATYSYDVGSIVPYTGISNGPTGSSVEPCATRIETSRDIMRAKLDGVVVTKSNVIQFSSIGEINRIVDKRETKLCFGEPDTSEATDSVVTFEESEPKYPFLYSVITTEKKYDETTVISNDGKGSIEEYFLNPDCAGVLQNGWSYMFRRSLLGAGTAWQDALAFGASILMDRETITGGYPKVSTPSFVGWA